MIIIVGSRHDPAARDLVDAWPDASLCSAEDMTSPGWAWSPTGAVDSTWVVDGTVVPDRNVTGVFVCRRAFYPEEFSTTHPDDRPYLAAEAHAFMSDVLVSTAAVVAHPVADGTFGDELLRPDRWMAAAGDVGLSVVPIQLRSRPGPARRRATRRIEVVGAAAIGSAPARTLAALAELATRLGLVWVTAIVDGRHRLLSVTSTSMPSDAARVALGKLLAGA